MILHPEEKFRVVNAGEHDLFYRNDGGHFVEVSAELGIDGMDEGLSAVWFDYDRDGWPDLYGKTLVQVPRCAHRLGQTHHQSSARQEAHRR